MTPRAFGRTGLVVPPVSFGAGRLHGFSAREAAALLRGALELGVTLFDTAPSYGASEGLLGEALRGTQAQFSTKGGYGIEGVADWSPESVTLGVARALKVLRVERLDVFHLHSCPLEVLQRDGLWRALEDCVQKGMLRVAAYSGDGEALRWAVNSGRFGSVQGSVNVVEPGNLPAVMTAAERGLGVLAKRALGNGCWRDGAMGDDAGRAYQARWRSLALDAEPLELFARFAAFAPGVTSVLVGTTQLANLKAVVDAVAKGPLPLEVRARLHAAQLRHARDWPPWT